MNRPALLAIDVQDGFDHPSWGPRSNAACDHNIAQLVSAFRRATRPVIYVRHDSVLDDSPLRPGTPGNRLKGLLAGESDLLVTKTVNSAFYGQPDLHGWLRQHEIDTLVVTGYTTNHCCETTARMGSNLGYHIEFVLDATQAFDRATPAGRILSGQALAEATSANLHGEFGNVTTTASVLRSLA